MIFFIVTGCDWSTKRSPSTIVIAVDSFRFDDLDCATGPDFFGEICDESVRFTHHFTTSILSVPAIVTLMTGRYPFEHGVVHNGDVFLSASAVTIQEELVRRGYSTAFFSGGPPVWRKSGIAQGFEVFDDYLLVDSKRIFRDVESNLNLLLDWIDSLDSNQRFFGFVYLPDIQFTQVATANNLGLPRARDHKGQVEEVSESLAALIESLKDRGQWDSTNLVLVGLNGMPEKDRKGEVTPVNLYTENSRTALLIKPAIEKRDDPANWNVDTPVNLVDVARYLRESAGLQFQEEGERVTNSISLNDGIRTGEFGKSARGLIIESSWAKWKLKLSTRYAMLKDQYLSLYQDPPLVFNIWSDRYQVSPIGSSDRVYQDHVLEMSDFLNGRGVLPFEGLEKNFVNKSRIGRDLWSNTYLREDVLTELSSYVDGNPEDIEARNWLALWLIRLKYWRQLYKLGQEYEVETWSFLASKNLKKSSSPLSISCFKILTVGDSPEGALQDYRNCDDPLFREFVAWYRAKSNYNNEDIYLDRFLRSLSRFRLDRRIKEIAIANGNTWDINPSLGLGPSLIDIALSLPEMSYFANVVERRIGLEYF